MNVELRLCVCVAARAGIRYVIYIPREIYIYACMYYIMGQERCMSMVVAAMNIVN